MYKWGAFVKISGFDFSYIKRISFPVTEELYDEIQALLNDLFPIDKSEIYYELVDRAKASVDLGVGDAEISRVYIDDPGAVFRFKQKFKGRTFDWYADETENECEFEYRAMDDDFTEYTLTVCFDKNGTITDVKDVTAVSLEEKDGFPTAFTPSCPDFDTIEVCLENDLQKHSKIDA